MICVFFFCCFVCCFCESFNLFSIFPLFDHLLSSSTSRALQTYLLIHKQTEWKVKYAAFQYSFIHIFSILCFFVWNYSFACLVGWLVWCQSCISCVRVCVCGIAFSGCVLYVLSFLVYWWWSRLSKLVSFFFLLF